MRFFVFKGNAGGLIQTDAQVNGLNVIEVPLTGGYDMEVSYTAIGKVDGQHFIEVRKFICAARRCHWLA